MQTRLALPGWTRALPLGGAALLVGLGLWCLLPSTVIVFNDDFGYLRSIVETLQHGRPWTNDWLEPWAASLSAFSAALFKLTGSFRAATHGLQAVLVAVSFGAGFVLLRRRSLPGWAAAGFVLLGLTAPALLFKSLEFGSLVLTVPCLLLACALAERQRWGWFFLVWFVAVATRQSALVWLALPGWELLRALRSKAAAASPAAWQPAVGIAVGVLTFLLLGRYMNETHARRVMSAAMWGSLHWSSGLRALATAAGVYAVVCGVVGFFAGIFRSRETGVEVSPNRYGRGLAILVVLLFVLHDPRRLMGFEHGLLAGENGSCYLWLIGGLAIVGWWRGGFAIRTDFAVAAVAAALLVSLRQSIWDYYLVDLAVFAALSVWPQTEGDRAGSPASANSWPTLVAATAVVAVAWFHAGFVREMKRLLDGQTAVVVLHEQALRAGRIDATELGLAPFGFQGWHLYPHFIRHEGKDGAYIAEFTGYVRDGALRLASSDPDGNSPASGTVRVSIDVNDSRIAVGVFPWEWRKQVSFRLERAGASGPPRRMLSSDFEQGRFPLDDAEWRQLVAGPAR